MRPGHAIALVLAVACASEPLAENQGSGGEAGASDAAGAAGAAGDSGGGEAGAAAGRASAGEAGQLGAGGAAEPSGASGGGGTPGEIGCPEAAQPVVVGALAEPEITEASGLAASRRFPGVLYTHNDSGAGPRAYALREDGSLIARLELGTALALDWEDVAVGPGPESEQTYLYIGDIGDNAGARANIVVHRALEPELDLDATGDSIDLEVVSLVFEYPDGAHDAETLFVDPETADLYVITKAVGGNAAYVGRAPHSSADSNALEHVTAVELPFPELATSGDISADGRLIAVRAYGGVFGWPRAPGQSVAEALSGSPCLLPASNDLQGEAIGFAADDSSYYTVGEGSGVELFRVDFE